MSWQIDRRRSASRGTVLPRGGEARQPLWCRGVAKARVQGCHLVDTELMTAQWSDPEAYLRRGDKVHQNEQVALATLDIYLNLIQASGNRQC